MPVNQGQTLLISEGKKKRMDLWTADSVGISSRCTNVIKIQQQEGVSSSIQACAERPKQYSMRGKKFSKWSSRVVNSASHQPKASISCPKCILEVPLLRLCVLVR